MNEIVRREKKSRQDPTVFEMKLSDRCVIAASMKTVSSHISDRYEFRINIYVSPFVDGATSYPATGERFTVSQPESSAEMTVKSAMQHVAASLMKGKR